MSELKNGAKGNILWQNANQSRENDGIREVTICNQYNNNKAKNHQRMLNAVGENLMANRNICIVLKNLTAR